MGADLGNGCVKGDRIVCPVHAWGFGPDGRCAHIPAGGESRVRPADGLSGGGTGRAGLLLQPGGGAPPPCPSSTG
ncbi:MAG: Rieske 2Fe-2S domain-containing protein [Kiritimatiellia bacterium]